MLSLCLILPQKCYHFIFQRYRLEHYTVSSNWLALGTVFLFGLLSLSRSVALFRGWYIRFALCFLGDWSWQILRPAKVVLL